MALRIVENITAEPNQRHVIEKEQGENVILVLRYHTQIQTWTADIERGDKKIYGVRLAGAVRLIPSMNMGVDFICISEDGIDPLQITDFAEGRCQLGIFDVV